MGGKEILSGTEDPSTRSPNEQPSEENAETPTGKVVGSESTRIGLPSPIFPIVERQGTDCPSCENDGSMPSTSSALLLPAKDGGDSLSLNGDSSSWLMRLREKVSRRQLFALVALAYGNFWIAACISLQAPFFPQEAEDKGVTATVYGFVFGVFELVIILVSPFYGKIATFVSSRVLISAGVFVAGTSSILFGFLDRIHDGKVFIALAFVIRIVEGLGSAAVLTPSSIVVTTEFPDSIATAFSTVETFFGFGLIVGPTLGGAFYEVGGFTLPFVVAGSLLLLGSLVTWFTLEKEIGDRNEEAPGTILRFILNVDTILDALCIVTTLCFFGYNSATLEPHLREFDLSAFLTGLVFVVAGVAYAITTPFWGYLCDSAGVNPRAMCVLGCALTALSQAFIGPFPFFGGVFDEPHLWLVLVSLVVCGLGDAAKLVCAFVNCLNDTLKRGFPDDIRTYGLVAAMFSSCCSIGAFVGPSIGGYLLDTIGYSWGTLVLFSVEVTLMTSLILRMVWCRRRRIRQGEAEPIARCSSEAAEETTPLLKGVRADSPAQ